MKYGWLLMALLPVLAGCANRYCERSEQVYESAVEQATLQSPEGLQVPPPDPNFAIPEATGEDVKYATAGTDAAGRSRSSCLDTPPPLPVTAPPAEQEPGPVPEAEPAAADDQPAVEPDPASP